MTIVFKQTEFPLMKGPVVRSWTSPAGSINTGYKGRGEESSADSTLRGSSLDSRINKHGSSLFHFHIPDYSKCSTQAEILRGKMTYIRHEKHTWQGGPRQLVVKDIQRSLRNMKKESERTWREQSDCLLLGPGEAIHSQHHKTKCNHQNHTEKGTYKKRHFEDIHTCKHILIC